MPKMTPSANPRVYLDHNATTPLNPDLKSKVMEWLDLWGNPSSIHWDGRGPKALLRESRQRIAQMLGCQPLQLVFTSGGSEANNLAIKGVYEALSLRRGGNYQGRNEFIVSAVEHPSVRKTMEFLQAKGVRVHTVPADREGRLDLDAYEQLLSERTALVSVMLANNETGVLSPVREMVEMAKHHGALFHTDAVQALGKIPLALEDLGVDLASFSAHKFYSLKGSGALFIKRGTPFENLIHGGGQERGRRGGTENLLSIAAWGEMAGKAGEVVRRNEQIRFLRDHLESRIANEISGLQITGQSSPRLPNTMSCVIPGVDGESLLMNLDIRGFSVSTGAACSSGNPEPSPTLLAMGLSREEAQSSLRVGLGWANTQEEVDRFADELKQIVERLRSLSAHQEDRNECRS